MNISLFSYIRDSVDIVDVIQCYVALKPAGSYLKGVSPFNQEKTASFTVSPHKKIFYCFSTNQGGDVIDFISKIKRISQFEAAQFLIEQYRLNPPTTSIENKNYKKNIPILHFFAAWCMKQYEYSLEIQTYVKSRSIADQIRKLFMIGYCPSSANSISELIKDAKEEDFLIDDLLSAEIIHKNTDRRFNNNYYIPYEDRLIFPILDVHKKIIGFGGRIYKPNDTRAKYYNSQTNDVFSKKKTLYAISFSKQYIQEQEEAIIVEGYIDAIALYQAGYKNIVATLGTACNEDHINILSKHAKKIIALYDGDEAGRRALLKMSKLCWKQAIDLDIVILPENEDPGSLCQKKVPFGPFFKNKESSIDVFIKNVHEKYNDASLKEKIEHLSDVIEIINSLEDPIKRSILMSNISKKFQLSIESLEHILHSSKKKLSNEVLSSKSNNSNDTDLEKKNSNNLIYAICIIVCAYIAKENISETEKNYILEILEDLTEYPWALDCIKKYQLYKINNTEFDYLAFFEGIEDTYKNSLISIIMKNEYQHIPILLFIREIKKRLWKKYISTIQEDISYSNLSAEEIDDSKNKLTSKIKKYYNN